MEPVCRARRTVEDLNDLMESGSGKYILGAAYINVLHKCNIVNRREDVCGVDDTVNIPSRKNIIQVMSYVALDKLQFF